MIGAVIASQSRSGTVGLVAMVLVLVGERREAQRPASFAAPRWRQCWRCRLMPSSLLARGIVEHHRREAQDETGSREARAILSGNRVDAFVDHPLTGVGAGQFKNYNPTDGEEAWRETPQRPAAGRRRARHLRPDRFVFLIVRGLRWPRSRRGGCCGELRMAAAAISATARVPAPAVITPERSRALDAHAAAMSAALAGWFVCALFASVAYNWTFYYLLALATVPREICSHGLATPDFSRARLPAATQAAVGLQRMSARH